MEPYNTTVVSPKVSAARCDKQKSDDDETDKSSYGNYSGEPFNWSALRIQSINALLDPAHKPALRLAVRQLFPKLQVVLE